MRTTANKDELKRKIEAAEEQLRTDLGFATVPEGVVDWRVVFAEVFDSDGFDVVLANPPYVVIKDSQLRAMYKEGVYGRMNTYGLFIQRSLQLMKDGAQLFFINPRTLLTDRYFNNLRKVIKKKADLKGVVLIQDRHNTFARVLQECIILHLARRRLPSSTNPVHTRSVWRPSDLNDPQAFHAVPSDRVMLGKDHDESFYVGSSEFEYRVFERMQEVGIKLSALGLKAETGKVQFDKYRKYAQADKTIDSCRLIWAENVQRYCVRASRKRIGKEWVSDEITTVIPPNITEVGIVTQRVSANEQPRRIIATMITPALLRGSFAYSENHTNFIPLEGSDASQALLLGALNSRVMEYIFRRLNSNTQVSAGEINRLPFPPIPDGATLNEIESLVLNLLALGGVDCQRDATVQALEYERQLDSLIGSLYGFSTVEVEEIRRQLPSYEMVYGLTAAISAAVEAG